MGAGTHRRGLENRLGALLGLLSSLASHRLHTVLALSPAGQRNQDGQCEKGQEEQGREGPGGQATAKRGPGTGPVLPGPQ